MTVASSGARGPTAERSATSGASAPASAMASWLSVEDARCHSAWVAFSCATTVERRTSAMMAGMPSSRVIMDCAVALLSASESIAFDATFWHSSLMLLSQTMRGGMPPAFAMATWFAGWSMHRCETALSTRMPRSTPFPLSSTTSRLAIDDRFSACLHASEDRAPEA